MTTKPERSVEEIVEELPTNVCVVCSGDGYTVEHDPYDPTGQNPMQVRCDFCHSEGKITTLKEYGEILGAKTAKDLKWNDYTLMVGENGLEFTSN